MKQIPVSFDDYEDELLKDLIKRTQKELARRKETREKEALDKIRKIAEEVGKTPEELLGIVNKERKAKAKTKRAPSIYRNPDNPKQTWNGRGPNPRWMKDLIEQGREQEALIDKQKEKPQGDEEKSGGMEVGG